MGTPHLGTEQTIEADRVYHGSRFAHVRDTIFRDAYQSPWGAPGQPPLPVHEVTLGLFLTGVLPFAGPLKIRQATERTVDSHADLRPGLDGTGFRRLLHPNGVCLTGSWEIDEDYGYSGYFRAGSRALVVARYSTCCTETRRGFTRSLSLVGKLYPTTDPDHPEPLRTASFITQQDLGGERTEYINDALFRNAPNTHLFRRGAGWPILAISGLVFMRVDREPAIRQLYEIAELGKPPGEPTRCPRFLQISMAQGQRRIHGHHLDFRDEVLGQIYDRGNPVAQRQLVFDLEVTDEGHRSGSAAFQTVRFGPWRRIGRLVFTAGVASVPGDRIVHFHHPTWRSDPNDPRTATRVNEHKRSAAATAPHHPTTNNYSSSMIARYYILFFVGLVFALLAAFLDWGVLPWLVGGTGIVLGFFTASDEETAPRAFWGSLGLVVATSAILLQTFNPDWLSHIVFYVRVFFAHVLLVLALARFLQLAKNAQ